MKKIISALVFFICGSLTLYALNYSNSIYKVTEGKITFVSQASFETISASSEKMTGALDTATQMFAFFVANNSFEGFNGLLQREHFNESYMESEKNPRSLFTGKIIEKVVFNKQGTYNVRAKGILNIHGVEQERILKCVLIIEKETIQVSSDFLVLLADYNIVVPRIVFEKVSPEIKVHVQATLREKIE